ncbi:MAG: hypothetical protein CM1200mP28_16860 [Deltaproteobacteria bacterium]|nr:MAG: hypothetical protein CM1200mP28_16860 [Deltaproteobacteria bacterium]
MRSGATDSNKARFTGEGRYFGGAMLAAPEAELDNGMLDLLMLKEISLPNSSGPCRKFIRTHLKIRKYFFKKFEDLLLQARSRLFWILTENPRISGSNLRSTPRILKLLI